VRNDLQYDLCVGCGERSPVGQGILAMVTHYCPLNTFTYRTTGKFTIRKFQDLVAGRDSLQSFKDLLDSPYFKAMPNFETASDLEKKIYSLCRDLDVRAMKRLRKYIALEDDFDAKW
jgi:hypothetical protein